MTSQHSFANLFFFSLKGFLATIIVLGTLLGYQEKMFGFSVMVVGSCLIGQSTQKMIQNKNKRNKQNQLHI